MVAGFDLYHAFHEELGLSIDHGSGEGQLFETHPTYAFKASLGWQLTSDPAFGERIICDPRRALRPKGTEAGRAQRIALIVLFSEEIGIALAEGSLGRMEQRIDWADAALCSVLGAWLDAFPVETRAFGDQREGSIWLRLPQRPFSIGHQMSATAQEGIFPSGLLKGAPIADAKRGPARLEITSASPRDPNAYVLRLGNSGPAGLSQAEALEKLFAAAANRSELWFAININNAGQLRKVSSRLIDDCWRFCASWNGSIRFVARVSKVVTSDEPQPVPSACLQQAWTKNGRIGQARCWVQLDPESFKEVLWTPAEILTWQDTEWRPGFPKNQTALLRAIVPL
jgi:hypothetical protein